jgi:hypothetical protein
MHIIAESAIRVSGRTSAAVNLRIADTTRGRLARIGDDPQAIALRLRELDREWDIERAIETNASLAVLAGLTLGATVHRRFFALPAVVGSFLLLHALQGWCPPVPVLRRLGYRTSREIEDERRELLRRSAEQSEVHRHLPQRDLAPAQPALGAVEER